MYLNVENDASIISLSSFLVDVKKGSIGKDVYFMYFTLVCTVPSSFSFMTSIRSS
jgi:hypothetical protein